MKLVRKMLNFALVINTFESKTEHILRNFYVVLGIMFPGAIFLTI